jgi:hypothetical protein
MTVVEGMLSFVREGWTAALAVVLFGVYFVFAIKAPISRSNFRIANFILLPLFIIVSMALLALGNSKLNELGKIDTQLSQQASTQNSTIAQAYAIFLQKNYPTSVDIKSVKDADEKGKEFEAQILANIDNAEIEYQKQLPSISQQKELYYLLNYRKFINLIVAQEEKMEEYMDYASSLDFHNLSSAELEKMNSFKNEIDGFDNQITDVSFTMSNAVN